jgi:hypothetical protein
MTFSIKTLSITTFMILSITTLNKKTLIIALGLRVMASYQMSLC